MNFKGFYCYMVSRSIKAGATSEECDVRVFLINLAVCWTSQDSFNLSLFAFIISRWIRGLAMMVFKLTINHYYKRRYF